MNLAADWVDRMAVPWASAMARTCLESSAVLALVGAVWWLGRKRLSAATLHALFLLVLVKLAVPIPLSLPVPASWGRFSPSTASDRVASWASAPQADPAAVVPFDELHRPIPRNPSETVVSTAPEIPPDPPEAAPRWTARSVLLMGWAGVVLALLARLIGAHLAMDRLVRRCPVVDPDALGIDASGLANRCGLKRPVPMVAVPGLGSPAVWGFVRPRVLVPPDLADGMTSEGLRWVILHELVHVRRRDAWIGLFQRLVQIAYFFHPAAWIANRAIDAHREFACDDAATALAGLPRFACGAGFLSVVERVGASRSRFSPSPGLFDEKSLIRRRLMRILDGRRPLRAGLSLGSLALIAVVALVGLPRLKAQEEKAKAKAPAAEEVAGRAIEVLVLAEEDGRPIAGATVEATAFRGLLEKSDFVTDAQGRCRVAIGEPAPSGFSLSASAPGRVPLSVGWNEDGPTSKIPDSSTFRLPRGEAISGRVVDEGGKPIAGAKVFPWLNGGVGPKGEAFASGDLASATTDADGRWSAALLPRGVGPDQDVLFRLKHPDFVSDRQGYPSSRSRKVRALRDGSASWTMNRGRPVRGVVLDPAGRPVAGAPVALSFSRSDGDEERTTTDDRGEFGFGHVEGPRLTLSVEKAGFGPAVLAVDSPAASPFTIRLEPGTPLTGRVVDHAGEPVAEALVKLDDFAGSRAWRWTTRTGPDGRFRWNDGPARGAVYFNVSKPPSSALGRMFAAGSHDGTVVLGPIQRLLGTVVDDETGKPIETFQLIPGWGAGDGVSWRRDGSMKTLKGGKFDLTGLFPDQDMVRSLRIEADGYLPGTSEPFKDNEAEVEFAFRLKRGASLGGTVRDREGRPVPGVKIAVTERFRELEFSNGQLGDFVQATKPFAKTGPDGHYEFRPQDQAYGLFAYHETGYARRSAEERVKSGDLTLEPWGRIEGRAIVQGQPLADTPIRLTLDATDEHSMFYDYYEYDAKTDAEGKFVVEHVPEGVAHASTGTRFGKDAGPFGVVSSPRRMIAAGQTLELDIGGEGEAVVGTLSVPDLVPISTVRGRLVLKGPPMPARVEVKGDRDAAFLAHFNAYRSPEGRESRLAERYYGLKVEKTGKFRAVEVVPGTYTLSFWVGEDFQKPALTREITVGKTRLDLGTIAFPK